MMMSAPTNAASWAWKRTLFESIFNYLPPILLTFGLASNVCAFLVLLRPRMRFLVVHLPLLALSVVDCLALLAGLLRHWLRKATYFVALGDLDPQAASQASCKLLELLLYLSLMFSSWLVMLISVERFVTVCVQPDSRIRAFLISRRGLCWTMFAGFITLLGVNLHFLVTRGLVDTQSPKLDNQTLPNASFDGLLEDDSSNTACRNLEEYHFFLETVFPKLDLTLTAFLPFLVIAGCNFRILSKLRNVRKNSGLSASQSAVAGYRTTVMLLLTTFVFVALTAPVKIYLTVIGGSQPHDLNEASEPSRYYKHRVIWSILLALQFANHCCNFLLYCVSNPQFRSEAAGLFVDCCCGAFCRSSRGSDEANHRNQRAGTYLRPLQTAEDDQQLQRQLQEPTACSYRGDDFHRQTVDQDSQSQEP